MHGNAFKDLGILGVSALYSQALRGDWPTHGRELVWQSLQTLPMACLPLSVPQEKQTVCCSTSSAATCWEGASTWLPLCRMGVVGSTSALPKITGCHSQLCVEMCESTLPATKRRAPPFCTTIALLNQTFWDLRNLIHLIEGARSRRFPMVRKN